MHHQHRNLSTRERLHDASKYTESPFIVASIMFMCVQPNEAEDMLMLAGLGIVHFHRMLSGCCCCLCIYLNAFLGPLLFLPRYASVSSSDTAIARRMAPSLLGAMPPNNAFCAQDTAPDRRTANNICRCNAAGQCSTRLRVASAPRCL